MRDRFASPAVAESEPARLLGDTEPAGNQAHPTARVLPYSANDSPRGGAVVRNRST
jgi:hypothetical protein